MQKRSNDNLKTLKTLQTWQN